MDEDGRIVWNKVSKMEDKIEGQKENKKNIRNAAYAAVVTTEGVHLKSGRQRYIDDATQSLHQAEIILQIFFIG
jgi:hypothetical protein